MGQTKGFCSVFVMSMVMIVALMGSYLLIAVEREFFIAEDFCAGFVAENLAYAGICDVMVKLGRENTILDENLKFSIKSSSAYTPGSYQAYLVYKDGKLVAYSIGEYNMAKRQLVAYLKLSEQKKVSIMYLNRK